MMKAAQFTGIHQGRARGQGMTEYLVIVALVAVAAIGAYSYFGQSIRGATAGLALEIAGKDAKEGIDAAVKASGDSVKAAKDKATLSKYNEHNHGN